MSTIAQGTGPRLITLTPNRTYATAENAVKAVLKVFPADSVQCSNLTYFIHMCPSPTGWRYFPVFIGERALQAQAHFYFHVVA